MNLCLETKPAFTLQWQNRLVTTIQVTNFAASHTYITPNDVEEKKKTNRLWRYSDVTIT